MNFIDLINEVNLGKHKQEIFGGSIEIDLYKNPDKNEMKLMKKGDRGLLLTNGDIYMGLGKDILHYNILDVLGQLGNSKDYTELRGIDKKSYFSVYVPVVIANDGKLVFTEAAVDNVFKKDRGDGVIEDVKEKYKNIVRKYYIKNPSMPQVVPMNIELYHRGMTDDNTLSLRNEFSRKSLS